MYSITGTYNGKDFYEESYDVYYITNMWHYLTRDENFAGSIAENGVTYCYVTF